MSLLQESEHEITPYSEIDVKYQNIRIKSAHKSSSTDFSNSKLRNILANNNNNNNNSA